MFPVPTEEAQQTGHVRRHDRRHVKPSGGELTVPYATKYNEHQKAPGLPVQHLLHKQHHQVYGEHKEAFSNHVGTARRGSSHHGNQYTDTTRNHLHYSNQGGFARKQRDLERLRERTSEKKRHDPKEAALRSTATQLASSNLNTKSMFQHFDRNKDGTINFHSFSNGLRLAGVKTSESLQREIFDRSAQGGRLDYKKFVDDMKINASQGGQKTSLEIEDPLDAYKVRKEQTARNKMFGLGHQITGRSDSSMPGSSGGSGGSTTARRIAWNDLSRGEKQQNLVHDRVMRSLQEKHDQVEAAFVSVDVQRDGCLNKTEFQQGLKRVGITLSPEDATSFFSGLPRGSDGLLDYHQFAHYLHKTNVKHYSLGQVRSTNYTPQNRDSHIVQQRVADVVAHKRKDLEIVFREKDQGRGGRDAIGRKDGQVTLHDVDDVLKSCGIILSVPDTERLFDRVDLSSSGVISYRDFLQSTCGEYAVDLKESTETKKKRVRHLRSWNAIAGNKDSTADSGELPEDMVTKESWQSGRRPSMVSVQNPANVLQKKERNQLVTQQRIVDLYAQHAVQLKEVFAVHRDEPVDLNQFLRGTQLAGMSVAPSDVERLFTSLSSKDAATGRSYVDSTNFITSLESYEMSGDTGQAGGRSFEESDAQHHEHDGGGVFGKPPPLPSRQRNQHTRRASLQPGDGAGGGFRTDNHLHLHEQTSSQKTNEWMEGDSLSRGERLASEKILRKITNASNPHVGTFKLLST